MVDDSDEFELLLSDICENARHNLGPHLAIVESIEETDLSSLSTPNVANDIEVGTIVSLIPSQPPVFFGLGIVLAIQNNVFR
jgi:hypothetical protein